MLIRIILAVALIYIAARLIRRYRNHQLNSKNVKQWRATVKCAHCGIHIDQQNAYHSNDNWYCCEEHQRIDQ